jgi:hypothetical protein
MNEISYSIYVESDDGFCPSSYDMARDIEEAPSLLDLDPLPVMNKFLDFSTGKKSRKLGNWRNEKWCDDLSNSKIQ